MTFNRVSLVASLTLAAVMLFCEVSRSKADLIGADVTITGNFPTLANPYTNALVGTVPVSFPVGSLVSETPPFGVIPSSFDVTADQIIQSYTATERAAIASFNGVVYTFVGAPDITNVSVDPMSTQPFTSLSFTNDSVAVNFSGQLTIDGAMTILDITTGGAPPPSIPEPTSLGLLGSALIMSAGFCIYRRKFS
jgi:hypothetical protein